MTNASLNRGNVNLQVSVSITKLKQSINNLQNQIATQQALYMKQQAAGHGGGAGGAGGGGGGGGGGGTNDFLRQHDPINSLHGTFSEMSMNKVISDDTFKRFCTFRKEKNYVLFNINVVYYITNYLDARPTKWFSRRN